MNIKNLLVRSAMMVPLLGGILVQAPNIARADITINYGAGTTTYTFENVSGSPATVVAQYYAPAGNTPDLSNTYNNIASFSRTNVTLGNADALLPSNWKGSVVLSSDQDIIAVASTRYTGKGTPTNGYAEESVMYAAFNQGSTTLYAPQLVRISGTNLTASRLTIQNTTGTAATAFINWFANGSFLGQKVASLAAYGSATFQTNVDADIPAVYSGQASALITSTQPLAGFAERHWDVVSQSQNWAAGYALLSPSQSSNRLYSPAAFRNCVSGNCVLGQANTFNAYSTFFLQNTSQSATAHFTITVVSRATGLPLNNKITGTLGPNAAFTYNPFNNNNNPGATDPQFVEMGGSFNGSAIFDADQPVVGVGFTFNPQATTVQNTAGGYQLVTISDASNTIYGPRYGRVCTVCTNATDIADFAEFGNIQIINVDASPVTLTSIDFVRPDGTTRFSLNSSNQATYFLSGQSLTLQPGASIAINSRTGGSLALGTNSANMATIFGTNFNGSVRITAPAGAKIKAISTVTQGQKDSDIYNAINR